MGSGKPDDLIQHNTVDSIFLIIWVQPEPTQLNPTLSGSGNSFWLLWTSQLETWPICLFLFTFLIIKLLFRYIVDACCP